MASPALHGHGLVSVVRRAHIPPLCSVLQQLDGMPVDDLFPEYQVGATAVPHVECGRGGVGSSEDRSELLPSLELQLAPGDLSDLFCDWVTDSGEHQPMFTDEDEGRASPPLTLFFEHLDSEVALDDDFLAEILGGSC